MDKQLTTEQQRLVENGSWVVNAVLKQLGLQDNDELRGNAYYYLCKCATRYDATKGVKWSTYAYKSVYLFVTRENAKEHEYQSHLVDDSILEETPTETDIESRVNATTTLNRLRRLLTKGELRVLELKLKDLPTKDIAEQLGYSTEYVRLTWNEICHKARSQLPPP